MTPLKNWCLKNGISLTTAYRLINKNQLKIHKCGKLSFVLDEADKAFKESLPEYKPQSAGE